MPWQWSAWGKHPAFKDYFQVGATNPLSSGVAEWMSNGFAQIKIDQGNFFSWRFWMRGLGKQGLACGLLRDSSDGLGRSYPILLMGIGFLPHWEKNWDLLPLAFEACWNQMESLTAKSFKTLKDFEEEIRQIPAPADSWEKMAQRREQKGEKDWQTIEEQVRQNLAQDPFFITLDQTFAVDPIILISFYHYFWRKGGETIPNSIFMGGSLKKSYLAFYRRPLLPRDFSDLWSDSLPEKQAREA